MSVPNNGTVLSAPVEAEDIRQKSTMTRGNSKPDAGMREMHHYERRLSPWRHAIRQSLMPIVRWETPYLALLQEKLRTPALDSYFAFTANLGTHTFFMIMLPILFWCGYSWLGRAMVHVLAAGVFWSGFVKDMLCIPRPLSPPLQRISMSGSASLEYGFPSTHSTNAVSVALYAIYLLRNSAESQNPTLNMAFQGLFYFYAVSIVFGRLYCGMHGFFDVVIGSILGAVISIVEIMTSEIFDKWFNQDLYINPLLVLLAILILVRIHPEPADDCPCFDDSVAFAGVVIGVELGVWHYARTGFSVSDPVPGSVPFELESIGLLRACIRIFSGVFIVFAWRGLMKPTLFSILPPLFRLLEGAQLDLPRRFFLQASQYTSVPSLRKDDNVIPPASDIPRLFTTLRHPRKRAISIGPQSEADAYETLAYRQKKRRESMDSDRARSPAAVPRLSPTTANHNLTSTVPSEAPSPDARTSSVPLSIRLQEFQDQMGKGMTTVSETVLETPMEERTNPLDGAAESKPTNVMDEEEREDRAIFEKLERPRVRYDVEVVTKLIVYSGIAWLAVEGNPILFDLVGLGMGVRGDS